MGKPLKICIDYDGTYTEDPELWDAFIRHAKKQAHHLICATMRYESEDSKNLQRLSMQCHETHFTGRRAKGPYLAALGITPDIWIDDNPCWITNDAGDYVPAQDNDN
ncbi:hypothetical protein LCGC14_2948520 [marine sediment metagenome]|uniref:Uncharacterized protein n=1 Tax=marine sediment metagenome TaxID=412755 RepID=A0A0F8ZNN3_9ZZZZ